MEVAGVHLTQPLTLEINRPNDQGLLILLLSMDLTMESLSGPLTATPGEPLKNSL